MISRPQCRAVALIAYQSSDLFHPPRVGQAGVKLKRIGEKERSSRAARVGGGGAGNPARRSAATRQGIKRTIPPWRILRCFDEKGSLYRVQVSAGVQGRHEPCRAAVFGHVMSFRGTRGSSSYWKRVQAVQK
jgi:hypothetical protein